MIAWIFTNVITLFAFPEMKKNFNAFLFRVCDAVVRQEGRIDRYRNRIGEKDSAFLTVSPPTMYSEIQFGWSHLTLTYAVLLKNDERNTISIARIDAKQYPTPWYMFISYSVKLV